MLAHQYAAAVTALIREGQDVQHVLSRLDAVLTTKGHQKLKRAVLAEVHRTLAERSRGPRVRVARAGDVATYEAAIATLAERHAQGEKPQVVVDETLVGGFQFETGNVRVDRSWKRALTDLYRSIVA